MCTTWAATSRRCARSRGGRSTRSCGRQSCGPARRSPCCGRGRRRRCPWCEPNIRRTARPLLRRFSRRSAAESHRRRSAAQTGSARVLQTQRNLELALLRGVTCCCHLDEHVASHGGAVGVLQALLRRTQAQLAVGNVFKGGAWWQRLVGGRRDFTFGICALAAELVTADMLWITACHNRLLQCAWSFKTLPSGVCLDQQRHCMFHTCRDCK